MEGLGPWFPSWPYCRWLVRRLQQSRVQKQRLQKQRLQRLSQTNTKLQSDVFANAIIKKALQEIA